MKNINLATISILIQIFILDIFTVSMTLAATQIDQATAAKLEVSDCLKCHLKIVRIIDREGAAHKNKVTCLDCHRGHPPADHENVIPKCSLCHIDTPHFELADCQQCHSPHRPLKITLPNRITGPCITCHTEQEKQLETYKSIHSRFGCTACHKEHGKKPDCFQCHKPHANQAISQNCNDCHQAHKPLEITYGQDLPSKICAGCHEKIAILLSESKAKHQQLLCATCHRDRHRIIPRCQECHTEPHSSHILAIGACAECHGTAHDILTK